ncbi:unnamed protein product, partial [Nesidiocoris tenuis]
MAITSTTNALISPLIFSELPELSVPGPSERFNRFYSHLKLHLSTSDNSPADEEIEVKLKNECDFRWPHSTEYCLIHEIPERCQNIMRSRRMCCVK